MFGATATMSCLSCVTLLNWQSFILAGQLIPSCRHGPRTQLYSDLADFVERRMKPDHLDYTDEAG